MVISARHKPQWFYFIAIQSLSMLLWWLVVPRMGGWLATGVVALCAAWASSYWHDGVWWRWIHLLFLPMTLGALWLSIDPLWYFVALITCWLVFGRIVQSRVPLYLSNEKALQTLLRYLPEQGVLIDVGAGTGTVLRFLARHRSRLQLVGVEQALIPWFLGKIRGPAGAAWLHGNYQELDLSQFNCVYAFLSSAAMPQLWTQARAQMLPGSILISNTFAVPGIEPDVSVEYHDWKGGKLLIWRM